VLSAGRAARGVARAQRSAKMLAAGAQLAAIILLTTRADVHAQLQCFQHSDCPTTQYCDARQQCYECIYIKPSKCYAIDADCCGAAFLANCPSDPYGCGAPGPPPPPAPAPAPRRCVDKGRSNLRLNASYALNGVIKSDSNCTSSFGVVEARSSADSYVWEYTTGNWAAGSVGLLTAACAVNLQSSDCQIDPFGWM
jgi:hypothetical protein